MAPSNIVIEHDIEIVLRDGTRTHADVYRPDQVGREAGWSNGTSRRS